MYYDDGAEMPQGLCRGDALIKLYFTDGAGVVQWCCRRGAVLVQR